MIEHIDAISNLDEIFKVENIDTVLVGPYDLSGSMGIPGQFEDPAFKEALKEIQAKTGEFGINLGIHEVHPTTDKIQNLIDNGYRFIACGLDTLFLADSVRSFLGPIIMGEPIK